MRIHSFVLSCFLALASPAFAAGPGCDSGCGLTSGHSDLPGPNKPIPESRQAYRNYKSDQAQQERVQTYQRDIWKELKGDLANTRFGQSSPQSVQGIVEKAQQDGPYHEKHLLLFISSSMPESTLKHYVQALDGNPYAIMVLRGPIGNKPKLIPTLTWIQNLLCVDPKDESTCSNVQIEINPDLFTRVGIEKVPAVTYLPDPSWLQSQEEIESYIFYGDVAPEYALNQIQNAIPNDENIVMLSGWFFRNWHKGGDRNE